MSYCNDNIFHYIILWLAIFETYLAHTPVKKQNPLFVRLYRTPVYANSVQIPNFVF